MGEHRSCCWPRVAIAIGLVLGAASAAGGQTPTSAFSDLRRYLRTPPTADVAAVQGQPVPGGRPVGSSLGAVASRVKSGAAVSVLSADGQQIAGTFVAASDESLTVNVGGMERTIRSADIRQVVVAHGTNRRMLGVVVGGVLGAMVGSASACYDVPTYFNQETRGCAFPVLASAGAFGAMGGVIGSRFWRPAVVYATPLALGAAGFGRGRAPVAAQAVSVTPPPSRDDDVPVPSLDLLGSRVKPFERIDVQMRDGRRLSGSFRQASASQLQLERRGQLVTVDGGDVRTVIVLGGTYGRRGLLYGLAIGAGIGTVIGAMAPRSAEWQASDNVAFGAIALGAAGALYGGLGGLAVRSRTLVYDADGLRSRDGP